jgi:Tfp pilus assembly protein PilN
MIRTNLSTRPFYNERAVHAWLLLAALLVAAATVFNVERGMRYRRSDTELVTQAAANEARAATLHRQASALRATVDPHQVDTASTAARQANDLIDRRTFSWTDLLNRFETTLPDQVRITAIRPKIDRDRGIVLAINVVAGDVDDVNTFMENLDRTGAFKEVNSSSDRINEDGQLESLLEAIYLPGTPKPGEPAAATPSKAPASAVKPESKPGAPALKPPSRPGAPAVKPPSKPGQAPAARR